ncbi:Crp/Fnr family transcriptional regulator [Galbibacter sp. BG1]
MDISYTSLIDNFNRYFKLTSAEEQEVCNVFYVRHYKRRGFLLQEGDTCKHYTFVVSGCFKMYAVDQNGKEHNIQFAVEDNWIMDFQSFYEETPSKLYIEAMEPSTVLQINHNDLLQLYTAHHKFDRNFRIIIEQKYIQFQNRILETISATAEERYHRFVDAYPNLQQRIPNTQIASYLGITPEFLSKIRKKNLRQ